MINESNESRSSESSQIHRILPVWIAQLAISILGSIIVLTTSLQSSIVTIQNNPTSEQHVAAAISITSIVLHFFISVLLYLSDPPTLQITVDTTQRPIIQKVSVAPNLPKLATNQLHVV